MNSITRGALALSNGATSTNLNPIRTKPNPPPSNHLHFSSTSRARVSFRVSSSSNPGDRNPVIRKIRSTAGTLVLTTATVLMIGKFSQLPARAESPVAVAEKVAVEEEEQKQDHQEKEAEVVNQERNDALLQFIESNSGAIDSLKYMIQEKLELGEESEDKEILMILKRLVSAQPSEIEWKLLTARVLNELREYGEALSVLDEILKVNPLSYEALFQSALIMDQYGECQGVIPKLEEALKIAMDGKKNEKARDVRLIMAQVYYLQKNVDEALRIYRELVEEDPKDYRPYFAQGVVYTLIDRNAEAREQFAKWHELNPTKFEVAGYL